MSINRYYKISGKFNLFPLLGSMLLATVTSVLLTTIAALLGLWLSRPYFGIVLVAVFAYLSKFIYSYFLKLSKTRNKKIARVAVAVSSLWVAYCHMLVVVSSFQVLNLNDINDAIINFFPSLGNILFTNIFVDTPAIGANLLPMVFQPTYVLLSFLRGGGFAYIVYFLVILGSLLTLPALSINTTQAPFSEVNNAWMDKEYSVGRLEFFRNEEKDVITNTMEAGDISLLLDRARCTRYNATEYSKLFFYKTNHSNSGYVGIDNFFHKRTKEGEFNVDSFTTKEFFPPINLGVDNANKLEKSLNSAAIMNMNISKTTPNTSSHESEEDSFAITNSVSETTNE